MSQEPKARSITTTPFRAVLYLYHQFMRSTAGRLSVVLVAGFLSLVGLVEGYKKLFMGEPNGLVLIGNSHKAEFSRDFLRLAYQRLYQMERYISAESAGFPEEEKIKIWNLYVDFRNDWNHRLLANLLMLQSYYGQKSRGFVEGAVRNKFNAIHLCISKLRFPSIKVLCDISETLDLAKIERERQQLQYQLYCFASTLVLVPNPTEKQLADQTCPP